MSKRGLQSLLIAAALAAGLAAAADRKGDRDEGRSNRFKEWLEKDIVYIISDDERSVFKKLASDEEREAFIEQFWRRRDPDPRTPENEFKEEHYRRIAYANDNFKSGIEGWETDRGRIYITWGPPTSKETYASGSLYERRPEEGGATTTTWAFERWYYREMPGIGGGIELEFVDPTQTGEYRLAMRPSEKDALWNTGGGKTTAEIHGWATRLGMMRADDLMRPLGLEGDPSYMAGAQPFTRLQQYFKVVRPPEVKFKDLREKIEARVSYNMLSCDIGVEVFRVAKDAVLVPATIRVPSVDLTYRDFAPGIRRATISLYGKVETLTRITVYEFEDSVSSDVSDQDLGKGLTGVTVYQKQLPLRAGNFKLTVVVKDLASEKMSTLTAGIQVPAGSDSEPSTSSIVLADAIVSSRPDEDVTSPFIVPTGFKIYPNLKHEFDNRAMLYVYAEAYNTQVDQLSRQPRVRAKLELVTGGKVAGSWVPRVIFLRGRLAIFHAIDLQKLGPQGYTLKLELHDTLSGRQFAKSTSFRVKPSAAKAS